MNKDVNEDLLTLLAIAVHADKKIYASEIEAFVSVALRVLDVESVDTKEFEQALHAWFDHNRDTVKAKLNAADFENWFVDLVDSLIEVSNKKEILDSLEEISRADEDEHVSEKALVVLTAQRWNVPVPA